MTTSSERRACAAWAAGLLLLAACAAALTIRPLTDEQVYWSLRAGRHILDERAFPRVDIWTYTALGKPYVNHSWLGQTIFAATERAGGFVALRVLWAILFAAGPLAFVALARRLGASRLAALATGFVALAALVDRPRFRPDLFGTALLPLAAALLASGRRFRARGWFASLLALTVVLTNLHPSGLLIPPLAAVAGAGAWAQGRFAGGPPVPAVRVVLAIAVAALGTLVNPNGADLYREAAAIKRDIAPFIGEWDPTWVAFGEGRAALAIVPALGAIGLAAALARAVSFREQRRLDLGALLLGAAGVALGVLQYRNLSLAAIAIAAAAAGLERLGAARGLRPVAGAAIAFGLLATAAYQSRNVIDGVRVLRQHHDPRLAPVAAADFLEATRLEGRLANEPFWSGYLSLRLYPRCLIHSDGRMVVFGVGRLREAVLMGGLTDPSLAELRSASLRRWEVDILVVRAGYFHPGDPERARWLLVFVDDADGNAVYLRIGSDARNLDRALAFYRERGVAFPDSLRPQDAEARILDYWRRAASAR